MNYSLFTAKGIVFNSLVEELLGNCDPLKNIVRLVFWGCPRDNAEYVDQRQEIGRQVRAYFGNECPAFSYVAQKPLVAGLMLEIHRTDDFFEGEIFYREYRGKPYVLIQGQGYQELVAGGMGGKNVNEQIRIQAEEAMGQMKGLLNKEGFAINEIVRQWNYLEQITGMNEGRQRYQDFNDVRSGFYDAVSWRKGYPAATGIGTQWGGLLIDFTAVKTEEEKCQFLPLDNEWQVAAHAYSQKVLLGKEITGHKKTTPKFERAKVLLSDKEGMIYVSGTAAIRGEQSLAGVGILKQTETTLENIGFLISQRNLLKVGISGEGQLQMIRIYLKHAEDLAVVEEYVRQCFGPMPVSYLLADICRAELLIEVEGIAKIIRKN